jgi:hypothetical protein
MKQITIVLFAVLLFTAGPSFTKCAAAQSQPNIVFIMADDLGPGWVDYDGSNAEIGGARETK